MRGQLREWPAAHGEPFCDASSKLEETTTITHTCAVKFQLSVSVGLAAMLSSAAMAQPSPTPSSVSAPPMEFDQFILVLLVRPPNAPEIPRLRWINCRRDTSRISGVCMRKVNFLKRPHRRSVESQRARHFYPHDRLGRDGARMSKMSKSGGEGSELTIDTNRC